jgi:hypothetical protein
MKMCTQFQTGNMIKLESSGAVSVGKGKAIPLEALGFQKAEAPRFNYNRHLKVVRLSALHTGRLYPQEIFPLLIFVIG